MKPVSSENDGFRHNKTIESCSSSHSSKLHVAGELRSLQSES